MQNDQQDYRPEDGHFEAPPVPSGHTGVTEEMHEGATDYTLKHRADYKDISVL